jgi:hypothetical protein
MTDNNHPITPPPELVEKWRNLPEYTDGRRKIVMVTVSREKLLDIATQAARWGADQELLACGNYLEKCAAWEPEDVTELYNYRRPRPKPPSLKALALAELDLLKGDANAHGLGFDAPAIRKALEQLPE